MQYQSLTNQRQDKDTITLVLIDLSRKPSLCLRHYSGIISNTTINQNFKIVFSDPSSFLQTTPWIYNTLFNLWERFHSNMATTLRGASNSSWWYFSSIVHASVYDAPGINSPGMPSASKIRWKSHTMIWPLPKVSTSCPTSCPLLASPQSNALSVPQPGRTLPSLRPLHMLFPPLGMLSPPLSACLLPGTFSSCESRLSIIASGSSLSQSPHQK